MKKKLINPVTIYSSLLMVVTSLHHAYGAFIYSTPWRLHVLIISIPVIIISILLGHLLAKENKKDIRLYFWLYWLIILIPSIVLIGLFEGVYNHLLKNLLFYTPVKTEILLKLFPPPTYELPNDFWFEFSGILQAMAVMFLIPRFVVLTKSFLQQGST